MTISPWIQEAYEKKTWLSTRGGDKRRVICTDAPGHQPVIALSFNGEITKHSGDGSYYSGSFEFRQNSRYDLLPLLRTFDVCVYEADGDITACVHSGEWCCYGILLARATIEEGQGCE